jgi:uncharacterized phage infection (PIP) family protein YhgE
MLKKIVYLTMFVLSISVHADEVSDKLNASITAVEKRVDGFERNSKASNESIAIIKKQVLEINQLNKTIQVKVNALNGKINELNSNHAQLTMQHSELNTSVSNLATSVDELAKDTNQKTLTLNNTISIRSTYIATAISITFLLLGLSYWYLRRRYDASGSSLSEQMNKTLNAVKSTEEQITKADTALADSILSALNKLKSTETNSADVKTTKPNIEADHQLPLKLADEIHRMRKRLVSLPEGTKGLTPLQKSLERLESELSELGYEIIDHMGKAYSDNLSVKARFIPSDDLSPDQKVISKVVAPQINYQGVMIRMADIEVSIGS